MLDFIGMLAPIIVFVICVIVGVMDDEDVCH